jgi:hypothetical protein
MFQFRWRSWTRPLYGILNRSRRQCYDKNGHVIGGWVIGRNETTLTMRHPSLSIAENHYHMLGPQGWQSKYSRLQFKQNGMSKRTRNRDLVGATTNTFRILMTYQYHTVAGPRWRGDPLHSPKKLRSHRTKMIWSTLLTHQKLPRDPIPTLT